MNHGVRTLHGDRAFHFVRSRNYADSKINAASEEINPATRNKVARLLSRTDRLSSPRSYAYAAGHGTGNSRRDRTYLACTHKPALSLPCSCNGATVQRCSACGAVISSLRVAPRDSCFSKRERVPNSGRSARQTFSEEFWNFRKMERERFRYTSLIFGFLRYHFIDFLQYRETILRSLPFYQTLWFPLLFFLYPIFSPCLSLSVSFEAPLKLNILENSLARIQEEFTVPHVIVFDL